MRKDYYKILGLSKDSSSSDIKKAYRSLALKYHPDKNPGDSSAEEKFKEASEAYSVLSDPEKRREYDNPDPFSGFSAGGSSGFGDIFEDFSDIFGFGSRGKRQQSRKIIGQDVVLNVAISAKEILFGSEREVDFNRFVTCVTCLGNGYVNQSDVSRCTACSGTGRISHSMGFMKIESTCGTCEGLGYVITNPCGDCRGEGVTSENRKVKVNIPKGIRQGMHLRVESLGHFPPGASMPGDLILQIDEAHQEDFEIAGPHLYKNRKITFSQAVLGDTIEIDTLDGNRSIEIPAGTQSGSVIGIPGLGLPEDVGDDDRGNMYVRVDVLVPTDLSAKEKEMVEKLKEIHACKF